MLSTAKLNVATGTSLAALLNSGSLVRRPTNTTLFNIINPPYFLTVIKLRNMFGFNFAKRVNSFNPAGSDVTSRTT